MATVGGLRVGSAISVNTGITTGTGATLTGTAYTAPANGYAIITIGYITCSVTGSIANGRAYISIAGNIVADTGNTTSATSRWYGPNSYNATAATGTTPWTLYVGPGQTITYNLQGGSTGTANASFLFSGTELING